MSFSQSSSPTLMKEQYQKKENEKQRIIEKVGSEHVQPTKEEQDYATDVIKIISEQFSEDLITKNLDDLDAPIRRAIAAECEKLQVTFEVQKRIEKTVGMMVLGNGPIEEYLQDPEVTEIVVQRYDNIVVERHGKVEPVPTIFNSEAHLQTIIKRIVQKVNRQINIGHPIVDARLQDGSRVNATIPPVSPDGATLTIRKFSQSALTGADYVRMGSMNRQMLYFLTLCVKGRLNIFVSGGTGTGKTTMLNMLSSYIAENDLIITIEDTLELKLQQKNVRRMEVRLSSTKDMEMVDQKSLVKAALRQRPDRIILGEVRDAKSEDVLIQAYVKAVYGDDQEVKTEASQKIQLICEYQMESPKVSSSATIIPGQDDVQLTFNNMNATATTSVTGYVVDFYIPSDLTVETIRVPEFVDSEGNSVERLITINGQHPSILNKTIFLYDKIGSFQMVVYTKDGTFSQSRDMVITASNQTSSEKEIEIKAVANGYYANNLVQTVESNIQKLTLQKVVTPPAPTPEPTIEPTVTPEPEPEPTQTPTQAPEPSPNPTTTPIPTPTITPEPTTVPSESDSVKKEAANLKPLTPNVSVSNTTSGDTLKAEKKQETNDIVDKLRPTAATAVQETAVTDDFSNKQTSEKTESSSANAARVTTAPAEKIEKTSPEKVKDAVEETVNENRGIQVLLILLVIIGCGIAVLTGMFLHFTRKKKHLLHLEEKMNDSKNVKGDS